MGGGTLPQVYVEAAALTPASVFGVPERWFRGQNATVLRQFCTGFGCIITVAKAINMEAAENATVCGEFVPDRGFHGCEKDHRRGSADVCNSD